MLTWIQKKVEPLRKNTTFVHYQLWYWWMSGVPLSEVQAVLKRGSGYSNGFLKRFRLVNPNEHGHYLLPVAFPSSVLLERIATFWVHYQ
jgi:hypothetical protein